MAVVETRTEALRERAWHCFPRRTMAFTGSNLDPRDRQCSCWRTEQYHLHPRDNRNGHLWQSSPPHILDLCESRMDHHRLPGVFGTHNLRLSCPPSPGAGDPETTTDSK